MKFAKWKDSTKPVIKSKVSVDVQFPLKNHNFY